MKNHPSPHVNPRIVRKVLIINGLLIKQNLETDNKNLENTY